jgi:hypothetical protein
MLIPRKSSVACRTYNPSHPHPWLMHEHPHPWLVHEHAYSITCKCCASCSERRRETCVHQQHAVLPCAYTNITMRSDSYICIYVHAQQYQVVVTGEGSLFVDSAALVGQERELKTLLGSDNNQTKQDKLTHHLHAAGSGSAHNLEKGPRCVPCVCAASISCTQAYLA